MQNKAVDGLRGLAALNVALNHFAAAFLPSLLHSTHPTVFEKINNPSFLTALVSSPLASLAYNGHFAVMLFLVISGYVLAMPYFTQKDASCALKQRIWSRYLRLNIPIATAVLLSYAFFASGAYFNREAASISGSTKWFQNFFAPDMHFLQALKEAGAQSVLFGKGSFIPPAWTFQIEFLGSMYVLLYFLVKPRKYTFLSILIVFILMYWVHESYSIFYYALFFGALINNVTLNKPARFAALFFGLYFGAFQFESVYYDFLPSLNWPALDVWEKKTFYNLVGACLVAASVIGGMGKAILESKPVQFLGEISFSLYLLHFIVLASISAYVYTKMPVSLASLVAQFLFYLAVCFSVSWIFAIYIDKPAIRFSKKFARHLQQPLV